MAKKNLKIFGVECSTIRCNTLRILCRFATARVRVAAGRWALREALGFFQGRHGTRLTLPDGNAVIDLAAIDLR